MNAEYSDSQLAAGMSTPGFGDEKLFVTFYSRPMLVPEATETEGRPIYRDAECIRIQVPGSRDVIDREVRQQDKGRFHKQYNAWKAGNSQDGASGTPLAMWPVITRAQAEELAFFGVKTVEQLAGIADGKAGNFMGINALKQKAADFLAAAKDAAPLSAMRAELDKRDAEIAANKAAIEEMAAALAELRKGKKQ